MKKKLKRFIRVSIVVWLSWLYFDTFPVGAASDVYVQETSSVNSRSEEVSAVYHLVNMEQEHFESVQAPCKMIYVDRDKIEESEYIEEESLYQIETTKYYSGNSFDFFNDCSSNFWFSTLENYGAAKDYQTLYMKMLELLKNNYDSDEDVAPKDFNGTSYYCIGSLEYASYGISSDMLLTIYNDVLYDHPLLFNGSRTVIYDGMYVYLMVADEFYSGTTRHIYKTNIENAIKTFETLTQDAATNFEIVKIVHDEVIRTLEYGFMEDGVTPLDNGYVHSVAGYVDSEKKAVCDGYACMMQAVLSYLDIENYFVPGTGVDAQADVNHAWNMAGLGNGNYYFVDATWDDTAEEGGEQEYLCFGNNTYTTTHKSLRFPAYSFNIPKGDYFTMNYGELVAKNPDTCIVTVEDPIYEIINTCSFAFEDGVLTFSGKGKLMNEEENKPDSNPWQQYKDSVTKIVINNGITSIDCGMFKNYQNLQTIEFGNTVISIDENAFAGCTALTEIALPDNMKFYGAGMFDGCTNLTKISFGSTPESGAIVYGSGMFVRTPNLQTIVVSEENSVFEAVDNVLYDKNKKTLLAYPGGCTNASFTVKAGTEKIMRFGFSNNSYLEKIEFPDSLKVVDINSFYIMEKIDNISFPSSVEYFYDAGNPNEKTNGVFCFCSSLKKVTNQSEATCYLDHGLVEDDTASITGRRTAYWYSTAQEKYVTSIEKDVAVLRGIYKPVAKDEIFEADGVTYRVAAWKDGLEEGCSAFESSSSAAVVDLINTFQETAGYITIASIPEDFYGTYEIPDTVRYKYWNYIVNRKSLEEESVTTFLSKDSFHYSGEKMEPTITVMDETRELILDRDYRIAYKDNVNPGSAKIIITGKNAYTGELTLDFTIEGHIWNEEYTIDKEATTIEAGRKSIHCSICNAIKEGSEVSIPAIGNGEKLTVSSDSGEDYVGDNNEICRFLLGKSGDSLQLAVNAVSSVGKVTYQWYQYQPCEERWEILEGNTQNNYMAIAQKNAEYYCEISDGINIKKVYFDIVVDVNFNWNRETETLTVSGSGNIPKKILKYGKCSIGEDEHLKIIIENGITEIEDDTFQGVNCTIYCYADTAAYQYALNYKIPYELLDENTIVELSTCKVMVVLKEAVYTGAAVKALVTVTDGAETLKEGTDYSLSYKDNVDAGTATVKIIGKGNYTGTMTKTFTIQPQSLSKAKLSLTLAKYFYDGKAHKPRAVVTIGNRTLALGKDYEISYSNNINIGTAKATIIGKNNYAGTLTKTFFITAKKGQIHIAGAYKYKVTGASTVAFVGLKNSKIKTVKIPNTVKIGGKTFKVTSVADNALKKTKVGSIAIGDNVKNIGNSAFEECKELTKVTIGTGVTKIGSNAFKSCKKLGRITIKSTVLKTVGKNALKGIRSTAKIKVPAKNLNVYGKLFTGKGQSKKIKIIK